MVWQQLYNPFHNLIIATALAGASTILDLQLHAFRTAPGSAIGAGEAWGCAPPHNEPATAVGPENRLGPSG